MEYIKVKDPKGSGFLLVAASDPLLACYERWTETPAEPVGAGSLTPPDVPEGGPVVEPASPSTHNQIAAYDAPMGRSARTGRFKKA